MLNVLVVVGVLPGGDMVRLHTVNINSAFAIDVVI